MKIDATEMKTDTHFRRCAGNENENWMRTEEGCWNDFSILSKWFKVEANQTFSKQIKHRFEANESQRLKKFL